MDRDDDFEDNNAGEYMNRDELELTPIGADDDAYVTPDQAQPHFPGYSRLDEADGVSQVDSYLEDMNQHTGGPVTDIIKNNKDGGKIDYILSYDESNDESKDNDSKKEMRNSFEENLRSLGIQISTEKSATDKQTYTMLICSPEVLMRGAHLFRLQKKIKHDPIKMNEDDAPCLPCCRSNQVADTGYKLMQVFEKHKIHKFEMESKETFFSDAERNFITYSLLKKTEYKHDTHVKQGIDCLLKDGAYLAAYPLHEPLADKPAETPGIRNELRTNWASIKRIFHNQPIEQIREYFGEQLAFYFAWLGVYTTFLIPCTLFGIAAFIYGLVTFTEATRETCDKKMSNFYVCPKCDILCDYTLFSDGCNIAKFTSVFDNEFTPAVAFFICLWGIMFGEFWKRKQNLQMVRWHVTNFEEDENIRPEFVSSVKTRKKNNFTGEEEPYLTKINKTMRFTASISIILFLLCVVIISIFGILVYRLTIVYTMYKVSDGNSLIRTNAKIITTVTAAILNIIAISLLGFIYTKIAKLLTDLETHRTQSSYQDSYTFKMIVFQFINYYGSLIYIAFFKGSFVDRPGYNKLYMFGSYKQDECSESGCFSELTIQLIIIMIGKQIIGAIIEMIIPVLKRCWKARDNKDTSSYDQWERDNDLSPLEEIPLFSEYLELTMQYGFIIMFVAAFPLAPLFAFINNMFEIRLDAIKFVSLVRRSPGLKAQDIGAWQYIIQYFTYFGIAFNAFIIAWTSEFIPKCVYRWYRVDRSLDGFNEWSMANFSISNMDNSSTYQRPDPLLFPNTVNVTQCRYKTFSVPSFELTNDYEAMYWHILCARWAFVIVFEHICVFVMAIIQTIPDITDEAEIITKYEKHVKSSNDVEHLFKNYGKKRQDMIKTAAILGLEQVPEQAKDV